MPFPEPLAGERLPAAELARYGSDCVLWTPTIDATTTDPTYGTGAEREGWYTQQGRLCVGAGLIVFGTGMTAGSGTYFFPLPSGAPFDDQGLSRNVVGSAQCIDSSAAAIKVGTVLWLGSTGLRIAWDGNVGDTTHSAPFAWASGDVIAWSFAYPALWP